MEYPLEWHKVFKFVLVQRTKSIVGTVGENKEEVNKWVNWLFMNE